MKRSLMFVLVLIVCCGLKAKGADVAPPMLIGVDCAGWLSYEQDLVDDFSNYMRAEGYEPLQEQIDSLLHDADSNKSNYIMGLIDAYDVIYSLRNDDYYDLQFSVGQYKNEINIECDKYENRKESIASIILIVNDAMRER